MQNPNTFPYNNLNPIVHPHPSIWGYPPHLQGTNNNFQNTLTTDSSKLLNNKLELLTSKVQLISSQNDIFNEKLNNIADQLNLIINNCLPSGSGSGSPGYCGTNLRISLACSSKG